MCAMRAMRAMTALLVMCCGVLLPLCGAQTHVPTFTIESPADFSTLVIKPPESKLNNLVIQFSSEDIPDDSEICVIISAFGTSQNKPEQCISSNSNHIALSGLEPGHYVFQFIVKSESAPEKYLFNTLEVLRVAVLTIADILPALDFATSHDLFFIKQDDASSVDVALDLSIAGFELFDMLDLCVEVAEIKDGGIAVPISDVCTSLLGTPSTGTYLSFSLPQLPIGSYQATLMLQNSRTIPLQRFPSSKRLKNFRVVSRADTLPLLVPPTENVEFVVEHMHETVEVKIPHLLFAKDASILQADAVQVCVRLYTPPHRERISEDNSVSDVRGNIVSNKNDMFRDCISVNSESSMSVGHLKPGIHHYELALKDGDEIIPSSMVTGITDIRRPQEFIPDFEWKKLHAWHTAPKGLEIRLPIGGSGLKEARVPEPWRMQLSMPHPCKFFLRLDTFKDTSVKFIRDAATKKCKVDDHCLYLETIGEQENTILNDNDTVLTSQMYQKKVELQFNSSCVDVNDGDEDEEDLDIRY